MKSLLVSIVAAVLLPGCGTSTAMLIHKAAFDGSIIELRRHLDAGVDANSKTRSANTPLHAAAYRGHTEVVELLVAHRADVNARDVRGWIPLHQAVDQGHTQAAELLIAKGADVNARMKGGGFTSLDLAYLKEHTELANILREYGAKTGDKLKAEVK